MRENGDVVRAIADGSLTENALVNLKSLLGEETAAKVETSAPSSPTVVTTVGMSWQDLVVAAAVARHADGNASFRKSCED